MALYVESFFGSVYIFYQVNTLAAACIFKSLKIFENFRIFSKFSTIVIFPLPCWGMVRNPSALQSTFWSFLLKLPFEDPFKDPPAQGELRYWINIVIKSPLNNSAYIHPSLTNTDFLVRTDNWHSDSLITFLAAICSFVSLYSDIFRVSVTL